MMNKHCQIKLGNLELKNPFMPASGCFGYGGEMEGFNDLSLWGAIVTKTVTLEPRPGNMPTRIMETPSGLLNSIGLANPGMDSFIKDVYPFYENKNIPVILSIAGNTFEDYWKLTEKANPLEKISALELNISCPNIKKGGIAFGTDPEQIGELVKGAKKISDKTIIVKLTPSVPDIKVPPQAAEDAGADILTLANTYLGMSIDTENRKPHFKNIQAGLSGPAIKPMALLKVYQAYKAVKIPIIGVGGISNTQDAIEFIMAGATALQLGTILFRDPAIIQRAPEELDNYLQTSNYTALSEMIGAAQI